MITAQPIDCLEIGSWQGASATWLLDQVVAPRGGKLTCIDPFSGSSEHRGIVEKLDSALEAIFDANIQKSGHAARCRKLVGRSQDVLRTLIPASYDFVYVDGAHEAKFVIQDAILAFPLLRPAGFMLFDDLDFEFPDNPRQNTVRAIEFFIDVFGDEIDCAYKERQLLMQKRPCDRERLPRR